MLPHNGVTEASGWNICKQHSTPHTIFLYFVWIHGCSFWQCFDSGGSWSYHYGTSEKSVPSLLRSSFPWIYIRLFLLCPIVFWLSFASQCCQMGIPIQKLSINVPRFYIPLLLKEQLDDLVVCWLSLPFSLWWSFGSGNVWLNNFNLAQTTRWEEPFWHSSNAFLNVSWGVTV